MSNNNYKNNNYKKNSSKIQNKKVKNNKSRGKNKRNLNNKEKNINNYSKKRTNKKNLNNLNNKEKNVNNYLKEEINIKTQNNKENERIVNNDSKNGINRIRLFLFIIIILLIILLFRFGYAFFNYTRTGYANNLVVGNIYMHYTTSSTISMTRVEPMNNLDENLYIGFTIDGLNEYKEKDIVYAIDLLHGDIPEGKTNENRIRDDLLRFTLTKTIDDGEEEIIFEDMNYSNISDTRVYVERISKNQTTETVHKYKLYMWISDYINVGNTENSDYSMEEWNNLFASIKVKVTGDFEEKGTNKSIKVNFDPNGGSINIPYKYYNNGDTYGELPIPTRDGYIFDGWTYANMKVLSTDLVLESGTSFSTSDDIILDGTNYINTEMYIFNENNWQRNFMLSFTIKDKNETQVNQATLINAKLEDKDRGYPGFLFRKESGRDCYEISANIDDTNKKSTSGISYDTSKVTLLRINKKLYYSLDDGDFDLAFDYTGFNNYFDIPLTIGASLTPSGSSQRFFKGTISDFRAQYLDDDATLENYQDHLYYSAEGGVTLKASWKKSGAYYDGEYTFDGTNYINTEIYLFNKENVEKNFYLSFEILENNSTDKMATPMSAKNEVGSPWPGFELRLANDLNYYRSKASKAAGNAKEISNIPVNTTRKVEYLRINNILYYNIDSMTNNKFVKMLDFSGFNLYFDVPVTFGASYTKPGGVAQRFFIGKLANMKVEFIKDEDLATYQSMLSN